jgi:hypothetical protein
MAAAHCSALPASGQALFGNIIEPGTGGYVPQYFEAVSWPTSVNPAGFESSKTKCHFAPWQSCGDE